MKHTDMEIFNNNENNDDNDKKDVMNMNEIAKIKNENVDMQTLMNLMNQNAVTVGQNAMTVSSMSQQLGIVVTKVSSIENDVNGMKDEIYQLKNNEEITTEQAANVLRTAHQRISTILDTDEEKAKYYRVFISRLWSDLKANAGCGHSYSSTKKCNYQRVLNHIEAWIPSCGISELKRRVDEKAKAKKQTREEGYDC